jgi:hypothetical protein
LNGPCGSSKSGAEANRPHVNPWPGALIAHNDDDQWLILQAATESVKLDRIRRREAALRSKTARHATLCSDDDRSVQALDPPANRPHGPVRHPSANRVGPRRVALVAISGWHW